MLILIGAGLRYRSVQSIIEPIPLELRVSEPRKGQLAIEWNRAAEPIVSAALGKIDIVDGVERQSITLTPAMLAVGRYTYLRVTDDIEVQMTVIDDARSQVRERSRFLGQPLDTSLEPAESRRRVDDLAAEVRRLRAENNVRSARIQTLTRDLRMLETRLGIEEK